MQRRDGAADALTDVHAFLRIATDGGTEVTSGRVDVLDVPPVVRAASATVVDAGGFDADGETALGIGLIDAHVATFDIADHGYAVPPFEPRPVATAVRRGPSRHPHLGGGDRPRPRGQRPPRRRRPGDAGASLERIRLTPEACVIGPRATGFDDFLGSSPRPVTSETTYTCASGRRHPAGERAALIPWPSPPPSSAATSASSSRRRPHRPARLRAAQPGDVAGPRPRVTRPTRAVRSVTCCPAHDVPPARDL